MSITAGDGATLDGEGDTASSNTKGGESGNSSKESHYYRVIVRNGVDERSWSQSSIQLCPNGTASASPSQKRSRPPRDADDITGRCKMHVLTKTIVTQIQTALFLSKETIRSFWRGRGPKERDRHTQKERQREAKREESEQRKRLSC